MPGELGHWAVEVGVPDEHVEVECAGQDDFVQFRVGQRFYGFLVAFEDLAQDKTVLTNFIKSNVGVSTACYKHLYRFDIQHASQTILLDYWFVAFVQVIFVLFSSHISGRLRIREYPR
jgi:hypothetical protein